MTAPDARLSRCVLYAARPVYRRFRSHVRLDDLMQELWVWVFGHQATVAELLARSDAYLIRRLRTHAERYARREKAAREGYSPDDEAFYSIGQIIGLLPDVLDPYALPSQVRASEISGKSESYMDWETSVADVRKAASKLADGHLREIRGWMDQDMPDPIPDDVLSALRMMQRYLGGPKPDGGNK